MSDKNVLQAILDKVAAVEKKVDAVDKNVDAAKTELKDEMNSMRNDLTQRMDKLGLQFARLENGAPTIDEFEKLVRGGHQTRGPGLRELNPFPSSVWDIRIRRPSVASRSRPAVSDLP